MSKIETTLTDINNLFGPQNKYCVNAVSVISHQHTHLSVSLLHQNIYFSDVFRATVSVGLFHLNNLCIHLLIKINQFVNYPKHFFSVSTSGDHQVALKPSGHSAVTFTY